MSMFRKVAYSVSLKSAPEPFFIMGRVIAGADGRPLLVVLSSSPFEDYSGTFDLTGFSPEAFLLFRVARWFGSDLRSLELCE